MGYFSHCRGIQCTYLLNSNNLKADGKVEDEWENVNSSNWCLKLANTNGLQMKASQFCLEFLYVPFCSSSVGALAPHSPLTQSIRIRLFFLFRGIYHGYLIIIMQCSVNFCDWSIIFFCWSHYWVKRERVVSRIWLHFGCNAIEIVVNWKLYIWIW